MNRVSGADKRIDLTFRCPFSENRIASLQKLEIQEIEDENKTKVKKETRKKIAKVATVRTVN